MCRTSVSVTTRVIVICFSFVSSVMAQVYCPDGSCNFGETCQTCPQDCHECDDTCCDAFAGENQCTCPDDCGAPPANEIPGSTCDDGIDNNCDSLTDCDDPDCETDAACAPFCDDGNCDPNEDQCTCPADCGTPPAGESPGQTCGDGRDNDCDSLTDCDDPDCETDTACASPPPPSVPTISEWGMIVIALLLLTGIIIKFGRRRSAGMSLG